MRRLVSEKLLTIIAAGELENTLVEIARKRGVTGYTVIQAHGAGSSGVQSGMLDIDTNILFYVIVPEARISPLLDDLERLIRKSYHLKVFASDIMLLPLGQQRPPGDAT